MSTNPINVNDNERFINKSSMNNDNDTKRVDSVAERLVEKFCAPDSREFYCKVAWKLPGSTIDRLVTTAVEKGKNPGALFNHLARKEMQ